MARRETDTPTEEQVVISLTYDQAALMLDLLVDLICIEEQDNRKTLREILAKVQNSALEPVKPKEQTKCESQPTPKQEHTCT